jgi:thioredoxin 1
MRGVDMEKSVTLSEASFDQTVIDAKIPILVDFWAPWCAPCQAIAPILEELAEEYEGKIVIGRLNVDEAPQVAGKYGISAIPTMLLFKEGKPVSQIVGFRPKGDLKKALDEIM